MQNHREIDLPDNGGYAALSEHDEVQACVFFVHGFFGSPRGTWKGFSPTLTTHPDFTNSDLFFLSYRDRRAQLREAGSAVFRAIQRCLHHRRATKGDQLIEYERMILVGHSLGGPVLRAAVLDARQHALKHGDDGATFPRATQLRLFAPAIHGANVNGFLTPLRAASPLLAPLFAGPAYRDLTHKTDSLKRLRSDTEEATTQIQEGPLVADILWAQRDHLVEAGGGYKDDHFAPSANATTHWSICKPDKSHKEPVSFLIDGCKAV